MCNAPRPVITSYGFLPRIVGISSRCGCIASLFALLTAAAIAEAQPASAPHAVSAATDLSCKIIDVYVGRNAAIRLSDQLELSQAQIAMFLDYHREYAGDISKLDKDTSERMDRSGRQQCHEMSRKSRETGEELDLDAYNVYFREYTTVRAKALRKSDAILRRFLDQTHYLLEEKQRPLLPQASDSLYRYCYAERWRGTEGPGSDFSLYHIDVVDMTYEYLEDALWPHFQDNVEAKVHILSEIIPHLDAYSSRYHQYILKYLQENRRIPDESTSGIVSLDSKVVENLKLRWNTLFDITNDAVLAIAAVLTELVSQLVLEEEENYLEYFYSRFCPNLYKDRIVDEIDKFMQDDSLSLSPEVRDSLSDLYDAYYARRRDLRHAAIRSGVRAKKKHFTPFISSNPEGMRFSDDCVNLRRHTQITCIRILRSLDDETREVVRRHALSLLLSNPDLSGPPFGGFKSRASLHVDFLRHPVLNGS